MGMRDSSCPTEVGVPLLLKFRGSWYQIPGGWFLWDLYQELLKTITSFLQIDRLGGLMAWKLTDKNLYQMEESFYKERFWFAKKISAIYWMNRQQYAVFLSHLLETDSIPGVKETETITPRDAAGSLAAGWRPAPVQAGRRTTSIAQLQ